MPPGRCRPGEDRRDPEGSSFLLDYCGRGRDVKGFGVNGVWGDYFLFQFLVLDLGNCRPYSEAIILHGLHISNCYQVVIVLKEVRNQSPWKVGSILVERNTGRRKRW